MKIKIGQIWRIVDEYSIYNLGNKGDYFIITHKESYTKGEPWGVGCFWKFKTNKWGGMRTKVLSGSEINEVGEYVGYLPNLIEDKK